jgi:kinesin family protein 3/17
MAGPDEEETHAETLQVAVRVRPTMPSEQQAKSAASVDGNSINVKGGKHNNTCQYDTVFGETATQDDVFEFVKPSVLQVAQGYNATIFAYGQTGTGKTYTMLGDELEKDLDQNLEKTEKWGVLPRAVDALFREFEEGAAHGTAAVVHAAYMQIYNDNIYDLLVSGRNQAPLQIREAVKGNSCGVFVSGLSEVRVSNTHDVLNILKKAGRNRNIRATEMNEQSSRSHAILQISVEVESRVNDGATVIRRAKLNMVDLAGSEKWNHKVDMEKGHAKELMNINKSLSALGNVIAALSEKKRAHVPYRDAKLTRLLQDSLGGSTHTTVIATISPSQLAIDETVSTLSFADRAKSVMVRVQVNEVVDDAVLLARAQREIIRLKLKVRELEKGGGGGSKGGGGGGKGGEGKEDSGLERRMQLMEKENKRLQDENRKLRRKLRKAETSGTSGAKQGPPGSYDSFDESMDDEDEHEDDDGMPMEDDGLALDYDGLRAQLSEKDLKKQEDNFSKIQEERRKLEEQYASLQNKIKAGLEEEQDLEKAFGEGEAAAETADDDDTCPVCKRGIDDHTDAELDLCIEQEAAMEEGGAAAPPPNPACANSPSSHSHHGHDHTHTEQSPSTSPGASSSSSSRTVLPNLPGATPALPSLVPPLHPSSSASSLGARGVHGGVGKMGMMGGKGPEGMGGGRGPMAGPVPPQFDADEEMMRRGEELMRMSGDYLGKTKGAKGKSRSSKGRHLSQSKRAKPPGAPVTPDKSLRKSKARRAKPNVGYNVKLDSSAQREQAAQLQFSMGDVGSKIAIYQYRYDHWYPCTVVGFDRRRNLHCCQYDDGDKKWHDLKQKEFRFEDGAQDGQQQQYARPRAGTGASSAPSGQGQAKTRSRKGQASRPPRSSQSDRAGPNQGDAHSVLYPGA